MEKHGPMQILYPEFHKSIIALAYLWTVLFTGKYIVSITWVAKFRTTIHLYLWKGCIVGGFMRLTHHVSTSCNFTENMPFTLRLKG